MELKMTMKPELKMTQRLNQEARLELRQALTLAMRQQISEIQGETVGRPTELVKGVIERVVSRMNPPALREALRAVFIDESFLAQIITDAPVLMTPTKRAVQECVLHHFYNVHRGEFSLRSEDDSREGDSYIAVDPMKIPYEAFARAYFSPKDLMGELALVEGEMRNRSDEGVLIRRREIKDALAVIDAAKESLDLLESALTVVLTAKEERVEVDRQPLLRDFLMEYVVLGKASFVISDRLQKRFAASFSRAKEGNSERLEDAFLNTIGEYVLIAMGVIDADIFKLQRMVIDEEEAKNLRNTFKEAGLNYDALCKKYALKGEGKIFWNRWATLEVPMSLDTDERVRAFITESVRAHREIILSAANYQGIFEDVLEAKEENPGSSKEARLDLRDALRAVIATALQEERLQDQLKRLIKDKWYPELKTFFRKK